MSSSETSWFDAQRRQMVRTVQRQGVTDARVVDALSVVRREAFVPPDLREHAYDDSALPIGFDQTISQPYIVALMASELELAPHDRVLEVGTGSGYAAAILALLSAEVYTLERLPALADQARQRLESEGFANTHVRAGDGTLGWPEHKPYDAISVAAGGPNVPQLLLDQLSIGGRLVMPVGEAMSSQKLVRVRRKSQDEFQREELCNVRFVPLVGKHGWRS